MEGPRQSGPQLKATLCGQRPKLERLVTPVVRWLYEFVARRPTPSSRSRALLAGMTIFGLVVSASLGAIAGVILMLLGYDFRLFLFVIAAFAAVGAVQGLRAGQATLSAQINSDPSRRRDAV